MIKEGLSHFAQTYITTLGLMIFFVFFVSMLFVVYRKGTNQLYSHVEKFPMEDGELK